MTRPPEPLHDANSVDGAEGWTRKWNVESHMAYVSVLASPLAMLSNVSPPSGDLSSDACFCPIAYDLALSDTVPQLVIAGTQDNGNIRFSGTTSWEHFHPLVPTVLDYCAGCGGDGAAVAIDPSELDVLYASLHW